VIGYLLLIEDESVSDGLLIERFGVLLLKKTGLRATVSPLYFSLGVRIVHAGKSHDTERLHSNHPLLVVLPRRPRNTSRTSQTAMMEPPRRLIRSPRRRDQAAFRHASFRIMCENASAWWRWRNA